MGSCLGWFNFCFWKFQVKFSRVLIFIFTRFFLRNLYRMFGSVFIHFSRCSHPIFSQFIDQLGKVIFSYLLNNIWHLFHMKHIIVCIELIWLHICECSFSIKLFSITSNLWNDLVMLYVCITHSSKRIIWIYLFDWQFFGYRVECLKCPHFLDQGFFFNLFVQIILNII